MSRFSGIGKQPAAIALGAILVVLIAIIAITGDIGQADVPDDDVAVVDGDGISKEQFDTALSQAALRQGLPEPPPPDDPQYEALRDQALNDLLDTAWILGEADEQGIEVSDREVEQQFEQTKAENFKTDEEYDKFLQESGFTQEDIDLRVKLQLLSTKIQEKVTADAGAPSEQDAKDFYEANKEQFAQPESRDVRLVLTEGDKDAGKAADELKEDNSPENWDKVAAEFSTDEQSKDAGGVREGVTEGSLGPEVDPELAAADTGEVIGPIQTQQGFYVIQVDTVNDAGTVPFEEARAQIDQQLQGQTQQEAFGAFLTDYRDRWTEVTVCAEDFLQERCDNFEGGAQPCPDPSLPEDQQKQQLEQVGCPPPVLSNTPASPGTIDPFLPAQPMPQRPHPPGEAAAPAAVPGGALPGGVPPGGATQAPPQG